MLVSESEFVYVNVQSLGPYNVRDVGHMLDITRSFILIDTRLT
jgi:hypothetical protein